MSKSRHNFASAEHSSLSSPQIAEHNAMSQQRELDVIKRDQFELLSAYLDGEVSPEERRLVMTWLDNDPTAQCLYTRLLHLRQGFNEMRQSAWEANSAESAATAVLQKLSSRFRYTCMAGLTAVAVAFIGVFSGAITQPISHLGSTQTVSPSTEKLEITLDQPPIAIPELAVPGRANPMESVMPRLRTSPAIDLENQ